MRIYLITALVLMLASSCDELNVHGHKVSDADEDKVVLLNQIDSLEKVFELEGLQDQYTVSKLISAYSEFRNKHRGDERIPEYFLKAGDLAYRSGKAKKAAEIYKNWYNENQNHESREEILYRLANIYDAMLNDKSNAEQTFEAYLTHYPNGRYKEMAEAWLMNKDVPLDVLIESFRKKNNQD